MTDIVLRNVRKILSVMPRFEAVVSPDTVPITIGDALSAGEEVYGCYHNSSEPLPDIWVTSRALRIVGEQFQEMIAYSDMESVGIESRNKTPMHVILKMTRGRTVIVPIIGNDGKFFDAFEFCRFLMRTSDSIRAGMSAKE
jgi:hypothetical protein